MPMSGLGTITVDGDRAAFTFVRRLDHDIETVWTAITDPLERARWFGRTTIDPREGGLIETDPDDPPVPPAAKHMTGRILVWDPPTVFEHEWHQAIVEDSIVRYELRADGDGTILTFTHHGLSLRNANGFIPGTHAYLDRLAAALDRTPLPNWNQRFAEVEPSYR